MKPKVCFLGTVYNGASFIAEAIESILNQDMKEIEVIYIDDGSTDSTSILLDYYSKLDSRFSYYKLKSNQGISKAWNFGLAKVKAPIICICSADDVYTSYRASKSYKALSENKADAFYGAYLRSKANINNIQTGLLIDGSPAGVCETIPYRKGMLKKKQTIPHGFMSITTKMARKVLYREDLKVGIDYPFMVDLENNGCRFKYTKDILGTYRLHNKNVSITRHKEIEASSKIARDNCV